MRGAMNPFGQIQGGEAGESPTRALTAEPTPELAKRIVAHRVAHLFDFGGVGGREEGSRDVVLALRDRCGYRSGRTPCQNQKSVATPHILVFQHPANIFR